jgi:hypothetical protein
MSPDDANPATLRVVDLVATRTKRGDRGRDGRRISRSPPTSGYESSVEDIALSGQVFSDGADLELATIAGDPTNGYVLTMVVGVPV